MGFKRLQRVLIVRRGEDDQRHLAGTNGFDNIETRDVRHLYVKEDQVRRELRDFADGVRTARGFADHFDVGLSFEERSDPPARPGLVVHDQHPNLHWRSTPSASRIVRREHCEMESRGSPPRPPPAGSRTAGGRRKGRVARRGDGRWSSPGPAKGSVEYPPEN